MHDEHVEYVSLSDGDPQVFTGHAGLTEVWARSRANWVRFSFSVLADDGDVIAVAFSGLDTDGAEIEGNLWFRVESLDGQIVRLWSALDSALLPDR